MAEDMGDKTEAPSSRKLEDARARGQIAKSQDLAGAVDLVGALVVIILFGATIAGAMQATLRRVLEDPADIMTPEGVGQLLQTAAFDAARAMAIPLAVIFTVALLANLLQTGLLFNPGALQPNFSRLNPVSGLGRLFDRRNGVKTASQLLKIAIMGGVATLFIRSSVQTIAALPRLGMAAGIAEVGRLCLNLAIWLLVLLLILGAIDWLYQRWQHTQDLKMTKEEVKDERRSMEGDPEVKSRRLRLARQIALQRVGMAVPQADVVVTNPTHFSVAIRYDEKTMKAPKVVAKGADFLALRIRQVAIASDVPIVERPPLARALYAGVEVGEEVSPEFYQAIAEILAFVYRLDRDAAA